MNNKEREELDEFVPIGQQRSWRELQGIKQYITKIGLSVPSHKKRINLWSFSFKVLFRFLVETTRLFFGTGHQSMQLSGFGWLKTFNRPLFFSSTQFTVPSVSFIDVPTDRHTHHTDTIFTTALLYTHKCEGKQTQKGEKYLSSPLQGLSISSK